jgi:mannose-6-phosphate isomerase-like protein (cupin superfamily)
MKVFVKNIEEISINNEYFRQVLYVTAFENNRHHGRKIGGITLNRRKYMKTRNDGYSIFRCMVLTLMSGVCLLAMELVIIPCSYADGASDKMASNAPVGQTNKKGVTKKGYVQNIEELTIKNKDFRRVLYTAKHSQLVVMALKPKEEIGMEVHKLDQFFRVEEGSGEVVIDGVRSAIRAGFAIIIPAGTNHNIINTGTVPLKLYTLYSPPNHRDGIVHRTRADAEADNEHFDGKTTE